METIKLIKIALSEEEVEKFLREKGILKTFIHCPYCGSKQFSRVRRDKCYKCKREWSIRKGSILERTRISLSKFLIALKLFELEVPVLRAAKELKLAYNTVHRLFTLIRERIYERTIKDDILKGEV